ncbi:PTS mannitol transporter subunit IICB [Carnobacterium gallinarum]|uniref:PTS mannitol transporter subunit IICB n=1 Tax=Carnobacterium gallinarum TaxID=2749 RepID=UPI000550E796|nr:PTS mannitol transporter subunit IICB [Carnobacterium gallinarum]
MEALNEKRGNKSKESTKVSTKVRAQKVGTFLSNMVIPNIGAFISWGLLTALFIPKGYFPNESLAQMVSPMITYLLPLLIGYTGGKMIAGHRGGVIGAVASMGVIVGTDVPMFIGAMIMGPIAGWSIKKFDDTFQSKIRVGFEMLVNNFSSGIIGFTLAILGYLAIGPLVTSVMKVLSSGIEFMINANLLPLVNVFTEPGKVIFLNNAINHGILGPLGVEQAAETGKSVLFILSANPGPGFGVLLAYMLFGKGTAKASAPGAAIIQFIGGIHELYFPYVLMKPLMILAVIAGGVAGTFTFTILDTGLVATASPGSIISVIAMTPKGEYLQILAGVSASIAASFVVAMLILKADRSTTEEDFESNVEKMQAMKAESKGKEVKTTLVSANDELSADTVKRIIFACDAGMGSSAMGASILRNKVKKAGLDIAVTNSAISNLTDEVGTLIVTQIELAPRALEKTPSGLHETVDNFLSSPKYDEIVSKLSES